MIARETSRRGFTLLEMLLALGITVVLMMAVNEIFDKTQKAIRQGVAVSEISATQRTIHREIRRDFEQMLSPAAGGFLAIATRSYTVSMIPEDIELAVPRTYPVKSDQVLFMRARGELNPMCPSSENQYATADSIHAPDVRVWYGHVAQLNRDHTDAGNLDGTGDTDGPANNDVPNPNRLAFNWVLGRQALFLADNGASGAGGMGLTYYVPDAKAATTVSNINGGSNPRPPTGTQMYFGYTDVAAYPGGALQSPLSLIHADLLATPNNISNYMFLGNRLRAAMRARFNPTITAANRTLAAWQIAQMHPVFAEHVSDFIVEFAGDFVTNGTTTPTPDGLLDTYASTETAYPSPNNNMRDLGRYKDATRWYGGEEDRVAPPGGDAALSTQTSKGFHVIPASGTTGNYKLYYWEPFRTELWPRLIRIRYRLHDQRGKIVNPDDTTKPGQVFEQIIPVRRS